MKITALILTMIMLITLISGCAGQEKPTEPTSEATSQVTSEAETAETVDFSKMTFIENLTYNRTQISDNLPDNNYEGYKFRIGYLCQDGGKSIYTQDWIAEEENGEVVNDAVFYRNRTVEERYNVNIEFVEHKDSSYDKAVSSPILAGDDTFDMMSNHPGFYGKFIMNGYFVPLTDLNYLDFTKPWWMNDSIKSYSYKGNIYAAFGAATSISLIADSPVIFFNKTIAENYNIGNLYDVVRDNKWTYEYFTSLIKDVRSDIDGDGEYTDKDQYGLHISQPNQLYRYIWSMGGKYVSINEENVPVLNLNNEKNQIIYNNTRELFNSDSVFHTNDYAVDGFIAGQMLFENNNMSFISAFRNLDFEFGILPNFKLDEEQENYYTNGGGGPQAIPITCTDTERTSIIMEALNAEGYKQVIPMYYETATKVKYVSDDDSSEMLDLIYSNVVYDSCRLFCENATFMLSDYTTGKKDFSSYVASKETALQKALDNSIDVFEELIAK